MENKFTKEVIIDFKLKSLELALNIPSEDIKEYLKNAEEIYNYIVSSSEEDKSGYKGIEPYAMGSGEKIMEKKEKLQKFYSQFEKH